VPRLVEAMLRGNGRAGISRWHPDEAILSAEVGVFGPLGVPELILIFVVALLLFGPRKMPQIGRSIGRALGEFRRASNEFKRTIEDEVAAEDIREVERDLKDLKTVGRDLTDETLSGLDGTDTTEQDRA
jgi:TatA/E family protein of Tat protein translocase